MNKKSAKSNPKVAKAVTGMLRQAGIPSGTKVVIGPYKGGKKK